MIKFEELIKDVNKIKELEVKTYLPLSKKALYIEGIKEDKENEIEERIGLIDKIIKEENGLVFVDEYAREINLAYTLCNLYGQIEFDIFDVGAYDKIMELNLLEQLSLKVGYDYSRFIKLLDKLLEDKLFEKNSIQGIISRLGGQLIEKLNDISDPKKMGKLVKQFEKVTKNNPELLNLLKQAKELNVAK